MKYMLLIHQGDAPTPRDPDAWARLPQDEQQAVFRDYQAINQTAGVTPGLQLSDPGTATTVRVQDGKTLTTDGGPDRLPRRLRRRRGGRAGRLRDRRGALAARRSPVQPARLAGHDGAQPGRRPPPPRSHARREDPPARGP